MTRLVALVFGLVLLTPVAFAATADQALQAELNRQLQAVQAKMGDRLTADGPVAVAQKGGEWVITYPTLRVMVEDKKSFWRIPPMTLTLNAIEGAMTGSVPLKATLPATIDQVSITGTVLRQVSLKGQQISGQWSLKENAVERLDARLDQMIWRDVYADATTTLNQVAIKTLGQFKDPTTMNLLLDVQTGALLREPSGFSASLMPTQSSVTGQIKKVPKALSMMGLLFPVPGLQAALVESGAEVQMDDIAMTLKSGAKVNGKGWFKPALPDSPLPVTGRVNLEWQNLREVMTALQQNMAQVGDASDPADSQKDTTQSMLLLMLVQGLGKVTDKVTGYTVDLTPEGQILLNGTDVTGMVMGKRSVLNLFQPKNTPPEAPAKGI